VNIALIYQSRPVLGVIYIPVKGLFYLGTGAWLVQASGIIALTTVRPPIPWPTWPARLPDPIGPLLHRSGKPLSHVSGD